MQMARALQQYGATGQVGQIVAITLVRELGPLLTAMRSGGAQRIGNRQRIGIHESDRADRRHAGSGHRSDQKLVKPRVIAFAVMLPCLTIIADFVGMLGGFLIAHFTLNLTGMQYWTTAYQALEYNDIAQGLIKPFVFAFVISLVGCFYGMRTSGGTQGDPPGDH